VAETAPVAAGARVCKGAAAVVTPETTAESAGATAPVTGAAEFKMPEMPKLSALPEAPERRLLLSDAAVGVNNPDNALDNEVLDNEVLDNEVLDNEVLDTEGMALPAVVCNSNGMAHPPSAALPPVGASDPGAEPTPVTPPPAPVTTPAVAATAAGAVRAPLFR
jgi:hypothetical protein